MSEPSDVLIAPGPFIAGGTVIIQPQDITPLGGNTPAYGLPYPGSEEPANQGANNIRDLALAVDKLYTAGKNSPTGGADGRVAFPHGMGVTPRVVVVGQTMLTPDGDNVIDMIARPVFCKADATNITIRVYDMRGNCAVFAANPVGVAWIALR